jgi:predicted metalloprotease with PDZ domain
MPNTHYFEVSIHVSNFKQLVPDPNKLHLVMPVWTPGSYLVREFSKNVLDLEAKLVDVNKEAPSYKISKNEWIVETQGSDDVEINYLVYAFELTVNSSYLDNKHGIINGASVFMYVEGTESSEATLVIHPFWEWKNISTGLRRIESIDSQDAQFLVPNFDILVDSPIEIGNQSLHSFTLDDVKYEISIFSISKFDEVQFVSDIKKIVQITTKVFSEVPYNRYVFLVDFTSDSFGGLEHLNSTYCLAPIFRLEPPQEYRELLSLFSHEFFHAWNVKRMRPKGLGPFDYSKETYTKSLWVAEGITSYYDDLLIRRAGIFSVGEYLDAFSSNINQMKSLPGSRRQSAEEASFDSWIKHYRQNENSPNVSFSYYTQGAVIGWMLDMEIRKGTGSSKSLDDVMRQTYLNSYVKEQRGFTEDEFEKICEDISGTSETKRIFEERVRGRMDVDFDKYLGYAGLRIVPKKEEKDRSFLGVRLKEESGHLLVTSVLSSSPAEIGGLSPLDEIIGVNGIRIDRSRLSSYLSNRKPDDLVNLTIARLGALFQVETHLIEKPVMEFRISKKEKAEQNEKNLFQNWLGASWSEEIKYEEYRLSPSRSNVLDYV